MVTEKDLHAARKVHSGKLVPIETMLYLVRHKFGLSDEKIEDTDYEGLLLVP